MCFLIDPRSETYRKLPVDAEETRHNGPGEMSAFDVQTSFTGVSNGRIWTIVDMGY
jgi:hypothetical protein